MGGTDRSCGWWVAAVSATAVGEGAVAAAGLVLLRQTVPCVWAGASALGWSWRPDLLCSADSGLFGRDTWQLGMVLATVTLGALVSACRRVSRRLWRTERRVSQLLAHRITTPPAVRGTARMVGLEDVVVIEVDRVLCFCHGLRQPRVVISTGMLGLVGGRQLKAVLAHEHAHVVARDPLRAVAADLLAGLLFFVPVLRGVVERVRLRAEWRADDRAVRQVGRMALAGALHAVLNASTDAFDPRLAVAGIHAIGARIDRLAGDEIPAWRPTLRQSAATALTAVVAVSVLVSALPLLDGGGRGQLPVPAVEVVSRD